MVIKHSDNSAENTPRATPKRSKTDKATPQSVSDKGSLHTRSPITPSADRWRGVFRLQDQITLMVCSIIAFLSIGGYMFWNERVTNQVIEIDKAPYVETQLKIDINSASWSELTLIPGIGEEKAREIIRVRTKLGGEFADENELLKVNGVGLKTLDAMRPYLTPMPNSDARAEK